MEKILSKLDKIEKKQDRILEILTSKIPNNTSKLESAEIFFKNCKLEKIAINRAPDLLYPSIYSTREHAVKAIKTLQKKGVFIAQGSFLLFNKNKEEKKR